MTVKNLIESLHLKLVSGEKGVENEVSGGYTSDLLSDVMGHASQGSVWITLQTHKNVMAIASLKDLSAIVLVKGFQPDADMLEQSDLEGVPVLSTEENTFEISGKLYQLLNVK